MNEEEKIGKNLFEYNGIIYTDNIPKNMFISITKEQYAEYMQQKEEIERLKNLLVKAGYKELILNGKEEWKKSE